tara:strand:- start:25 stop:1257 length:1233 start_codon:yes stop_codon:yes gene_type:complete
MKKNTFIVEAVNSAMNLTDFVSSKWSSRLVGSKSCLECADYLKEQLSSFCDNVEQQDFFVRPGSFLGYIRINIVLYFLSLISLLFENVGLAVVLSSLSVLITVLQFFFYKEFVDFLFQKKIGKNVFGSIKPKGEVKQHIIISAHHDSAHIFNFLEKDPLSFNSKVRLGLLSMVFMFVNSWILFTLRSIGFQNHLILWVISGILIILSFFVIRLWFFYDSHNGTPGAGDNMICVGIAIEIGKFFSSSKFEDKALKHTKLTIASWDAEECGLRGARAFCKANKQDLQKIKTYNFNLECMYDHTELNFLTSDLNNFVPLSKDMAVEGVTIANELGYDVGTKIFPLLAGGTDAAEFAKIGIEATTLAAMSWTKRDQNSAYHTTRDTIEAVDQEAVKRTIDIGIAYVLKKDNEMV